MSYEITRREVLNNLIRFKENLSEIQRTGHRQKENLEERTYHVLLNRKTGDMRFTQKITALESHISRKGGKKEAPEEWKQIRILIQQKNRNESAHFEIVDAHNKALKPSDLERVAWQIASETLEVLNHKAKGAKGSLGLVEEVVLQDLSDIHLSVQKNQIEELAGWMGSLSRIDAEHRLNGKPVGTYLLRHGDEMTLSFSFQLSEQNVLSVRPYILTVVEQEAKIADILLLQTDNGWTLYRDDPNLKDAVLYHYFSSPQGLLHHLHSIARNPLV